MPHINRRGLLAGAGGLIAASTMAAAADVKSARTLAGKSFLVTGTSSGFGHLGAAHYARLGARVFATMRNVPRPEADALRKIAEDERLDLHVLELDVLSDEQVTRAIAEAERINGGPIDVLVNNAGIVIGGPVEVHDMEATRLAFDTNVFALQRTARAVLPAMRKRKSGLIFNVSSQMGRVILPGMGLYSASKFAVEAMSEQLAYELAPHGIEVVIIQPGGYPTEVGQNRAKYTNALAQRIEPERAQGYPEMVEQMKVVPQSTAWPGAPDPMDIPRAIAEIAAMAPGTRPLRRPVHPDSKPQLEINRVSRETQLAMAEGSAFGPWIRDVYD